MICEHHFVKRGIETVCEKCDKSLADICERVDRQGTGGKLDLAGADKPPPKRDGKRVDRKG